MGEVGFTFEIMRRGKLPRHGDKLVMPEGCYREIIRKNGETLQVACSNPKTCPRKGQCDLSQATFMRNGKEVK